MKFCPTCEIKLKRIDSGLACAKCGYAEGGEIRQSRDTGDDQSDPFNVLEAGEGDDMLPTIDIECEKCGNGRAVWWMLQTRSADEPTTQFYRCTECKYTWRNYA